MKSSEKRKSENGKNCRCIPAGIAVLLFSGAMSPSLLATVPPSPSTTSSAAPNPMRFYIEDYAVQGAADLIPQRAIERAIYPYMGPYRTPDDVDKACGALEQAYHDAGFPLVTVEIPHQTAQQVQSGIIVLQVVQNPVGRLRVHGSRYFAIDQIEREAPSLQEGKALDYNSINRDLQRLNSMSDRAVTVQPRPGITPNTYDVDLIVKDSLPLHGSLELNNRYSANTTPLRINGAVDYDNLWQLGHTAGFNFQVAPEDPSEVEVFSGYYVARVPGIDGFSLELRGTDQNSNVSTLGGIGVVGKGQTIGVRANFALASEKGFYHSISLGLDYKHNNQVEDLEAGILNASPITYYPLSAAYSATWSAKGSTTLLDAAVYYSIRGIGSDEEEFETARHGADGSFLYFRGDLSRTQDLPLGLQVSAKAQGQAADKPLVNGEQFSGGGLDSVRGYLESEELGDNAILGSVEMRSPSLTSLIGKTVDEWRFYSFVEGGILAVDDPLLDQASHFNLASFGGGTRLTLANHYNGSFDIGIPLIDATESKAYAPLLTFRVWAQF